MTQPNNLKQENPFPRKRRRGVNQAKTDGRFLIHEDDVADRLGLNVAGVRLLRASGEGPTSIKLGSEFYYKIADVEAFIGATPAPTTS
jgi:hypothetical protein